MNSKLEKRMGLIIEGALNFNNPADGCIWGKKKVKALLDEMCHKLPKPHSNYWNEEGHLVIWGETVQKWIVDWFEGG